MYVTKCRWNHDGSIIAVTGTTVLVGDVKETNIVQFFSPFGQVTNSLLEFTPIDEITKSNMYS